MLFKPKKEINDTIEVEGNQVPLKIVFSKRKTVSIEVHPDKTIKVRSPNSTSLKYITNNLEKKQSWIAEKLNHFNSLSQKEGAKFNYGDGDAVSYLGKEYIFKVRQDLVNKVEIEGGNIVVKVTYYSKSKVKKLFDEWFRNSVREVILERLELCKPIAAEIGIEYRGTPVFRKMKRRWGSCSGVGKVTLNYELGRTSIECIDYVILHEFCHLREMNHGKKFYALMEKAAPNYKDIKKELNTYIL